jgi:hypothetical protein
VHTARHRRDPPTAQPGQTPPHLPARHQTSQRHQIPTKSPRPQQHQPPRTTRNPTHPPTKLTALALNPGGLSIGDSPSRLARDNSQGRTHSKTSSNYLCTNDAQTRRTAPVVSPKICMTPAHFVALRAAEGHEPDSPNRRSWAAAITASASAAAASAAASWASATAASASASNASVSAAASGTARTSARAFASPIINTPAQGMTAITRHAAAVTMDTKNRLKMSNLNRPDFRAHLLLREGCSHHAEEVRREVQGQGGPAGC